jgi:hypothetical protein
MADLPFHDSIQGKFKGYIGTITIWNIFKTKIMLKDEVM